LTGRASRQKFKYIFINMFYSQIQQFAQTAHLARAKPILFDDFDAVYKINPSDSWTPGAEPDCVGVLLDRH
jgi:hypothetical protein